MPQDATMYVMLALIAVLIIFMVRNGRKRQAQMQELQRKTVPGAEVMLQSGIYAVIESIDEDENRATVTSGSSTFVVHRNAIGQIITAPEDAENDGKDSELAPDDDPQFGERSASAELPDSDVSADDSQTKE